MLHLSTVSLQELQRDPDALLNRVEAGEHLVVVRDGRPAAELRPIPAAQSGPRPFGLCAGAFTVPDDFDAPLSEEILRDLRSDEAAPLPGDQPGPSQPKKRHVGGLAMDKEKKARLEANGWKVGSAEEFLGLTTEEAVYVELRLKRSDAVRDQQTGGCSYFSQRGDKC